MHFNIFNSWSIRNFLSAVKILISLLILLQMQKRVITGWTVEFEKEIIFRAFTSKEAPSRNLAEVIHAGLVEACLFDTRDSLLFESQKEGLATGSFPGGDGPCQGKRLSARENKDILLAEDIRRDLLDFGNRITSPEVKKNLFTKANKNCNPPNRKKNDRHMLEKRIETVKPHVGNKKVTNTKTINSFKKECSILLGRTLCVVKISCTPSCSYPDFR